jgi:predicted alpha/beta hydrolase
LASLTLPFKPDELYRVPTPDGNAIALGRYHPRGARRFSEAVVLAHGLGANRFNFDFDETYSLARYLARAGFEAWVLELRGHGLAGTPADSFDDYVRFDVPTALNLVLSTGAPGVLWVGHSKGGMIAYAHLGLHPQAPIRALVTLGSPVDFRVHAALKVLLRAVSPAFKLKRIPLAWATAPVARLVGLPPAPIGPYLANADNMEPRVIQQAIFNVSADVAGGVGKQFARWIAQGRFDAEGGHDYLAALAQVRTPLLAIAGEADLLAPVAAVQPAVVAVQGAQLLTLSRSAGFAADYGHGDLVLGRQAPSEVFPRILDFLEAHSTRHHN